MSSSSSNLLSLVAGAAAGALAMYLLDPEEGERRREQAGELATDAYQKAKQRVGSFADHAADYASAAAAHGRHLADKALAAGSDLGDESSSTARDYLRQARQAYRRAMGAVDDATDSASSSARSGVSSASDAASSIADRLSGVGSRWFGSAKDTVSDWRSRSKRAAAAMRGEDEHSLAVPVASTAIGFLAVGAGVMWLFDPERGADRRALVWEKTNECISETGKMFRNAGESIRSQLGGGEGNSGASGRYASLGGSVETEPQSMPASSSSNY